jgi:hypothetical protein
MRWWSNSNVPNTSASVPEKRLLAAVLQRAVADYVGGEDELKAEAGAWLMDDDLSAMTDSVADINISISIGNAANGNSSNSDDEDEEAPLTFKFICEALDLDVVTLRKAIRAQAEGQAGAAAAALVPQELAV